MSVRYRRRAAIRARSPWWLIERGFARKGRHDCGEHVFYNHDGVLDYCYCVPGQRPHDHLTGPTGHPS